MSRASAYGGPDFALRARRLSCSLSSLCVQFASAVLQGAHPRSDYTAIDFERAALS